MGAVHIRTKVESETLHLPELGPFMGQTVDITIEPSPPPSVVEAFYAAAGRIPATEAEWKGRQETLGAWRTDPAFKPYWDVIDQMLTTDFASARRWADAVGTAGGLTDYDFDAWRRQRECDRLHAGGHAP